MSSGYNSCGSSNELPSFPCSPQPPPQPPPPPPFSSGPAIPVFPNPIGAALPEGFGCSWLMPTTETTLRLLKQYLESYRQYVSQNPVWISEVESALYWVSYLLSSKFLLLFSSPVSKSIHLSLQQLVFTTPASSLNCCTHVPPC